MKPAKLILSLEVRLYLRNDEERKLEVNNICLEARKPYTENVMFSAIKIRLNVRTRKHYGNMLHQKRVSRSCVIVACSRLVNTRYRYGSYMRKCVCVQENTFPDDLLPITEWRSSAPPSFRFQFSTKRCDYLRTYIHIHGLIQCKTSSRT